MLDFSRKDHSVDMPQQRERRNPWHCDHENVRLSVYTASNGVKSYGDQCQRCGRKISKFVSAKRFQQEEGVDPLEYAIEFKTNLQRDFSNSIWAEEDQARESRKREWNRWYSNYLASPDWRQKRRLVFDRANGICEGCRERHATQVHHISYANVGNEFLWELVAICRDCHEKAHSHD